MAEKTYHYVKIVDAREGCAEKWHVWEEPILKDCIVFSEQEAIAKIEKCKLGFDIKDK
jgi:hypothetical protein